MYLERINKRAIRRNKRKTKFIIKLINTKFIQIIMDASFISISVSLMIIPVILVGFNKVNITNLIAGIFSSFTVGPIMIVGLIFIVIRIKFIENILFILLRILINCAKLGAELPLNQIYFITPSNFQILIYYVLIFISDLLIKINLEKNPNSFQKRIKNLVSLAKYRVNSNKKKIISIILIIGLIFFFILNFPKNLKIYFVNVGQRRLYIDCNSTE